LKKLIEKRLILVLFISFSLLGLMSYFSFLQFKEVIDTTHSVEHSNKVIGYYERILRNTDEMESGTRGFVISGSEKFLEPYHKALDSIKTDFINIENLNAEYKFPQNDVDSLKMLVEAKKEHSRKSIEMRKVGLYEGLKFVSEQRGDSLMRLVRARIYELQEQQSAFLNNRIENQEKSTAKAKSILISIAGFVYFFFLVGIFFYRRNVQMEKSAKDVAAIAWQFAESIVETIREPLVVLDPDLKVKSINKSYMNVFKGDVKETEERYFYEIGNGRWDNPDLLLMLRNVIQLDKEFNYFMLKQDVEGLGMRTLFLNARKITHAATHAKSILLAIEDVTDQSRAEEMLNENRNMLQSIIDNTIAVIFLKDTHGKYLLVNRHYEELFHVKNEDIKGKSESEVLTLESAEEFRKTDLEVIRTGKPMQLEEVLPLDDGLHTFITLKFPLYNKKRKIYAVCGIATDISERKRFEEELNYQAKLIEHVSDAIISTDMNFNIRSWNRAAEQLYGWTAKEVLGKSATDLMQSQYVNSSREEFLKQLFETGYWEGDIDQLKKNRERIRMHVFRTLLKNTEGEVIGILSANRDITRQKSAEEAALILLEQLEERNKELRELKGNKEL